MHTIYLFTTSASNIVLVLPNLLLSIIYSFHKQLATHLHLVMYQQVKHLLLHGYTFSSPDLPLFPRVANLILSLHLRTTSTFPTTTRLQDHNAITKYPQDMLILFTFINNYKDTNIWRGVMLHWLLLHFMLDYSYKYRVENYNVQEHSVVKCSYMQHCSTKIALRIPTL